MPDAQPQGRANPGVWKKFTYAELLDDFRRDLDKAYVADDGLSAAYDYLDEHVPMAGRRKRRPALQTTDKVRRTLTGKKTAIKSALNAVANFAKRLSFIKEPKGFQDWAAGFADADGRLSLRYGQFDEFERTTNLRLAEILPEFSPEDNSNWPEALSAQQTLSLFTQLCLRIHSEAPEERPDRVMEIAVRMVVLPALAYAVFQAGSASEPQEHAHKCLESIAAGETELPRPARFEPSKIKSDSKTSEITRDSKRISRAKACIQNHAWVRLLDVLRAYAAKNLGEDFARKLASECIRLLANHVEHPHGSELWKALSRLSSTTPGANDLLVFEALKQLGHDQPSQVMRARLTCSRTRYRAIEAGYYDSEFRSILNKDAEAVTAYVRQSSDKWLPAEKLAKAFLLSRRCLIPSNSSAEDVLEHQVAMAKLVTELLESCNEGNSDGEGHTGADIDLLVQRYLTGFLTNPRFAKGADFNIQKAAASIERYRQMSRPRGNASDTALISLFEGRVAWTQMLATRKPRGDVALIYQHYGAATRPLFEENRSEQMLDSEAPVWLLPELICIITLGDELDNSSTYAEELKTRSGNADGTTLNLARTIQKIGERHYGIYFNLPAEVRRIRLGLLRMAKVHK